MDLERVLFDVCLSSEWVLHGFWMSSGWVHNESRMSLAWVWNTFCMCLECFMDEYSWILNLKEQGNNSEWALDVTWRVLNLFWMDSEQGCACLWNRLHVELVASRIAFPRLPSLAARVLCWDNMFNRVHPKVAWQTYLSLLSSLGLETLNCHQPATKRTGVDWSGGCGAALNNLRDTYYPNHLLDCMYCIHSFMIQCRALHSASDVLCCI